MADDIHFGMKKLALHNWREPDVPISFPGLTEEAWVAAVMDAKLIDSVPENVVRLFEVARGSILYGWLFYPLLTLAEEQLYRVQETAVRERCKQAGIPTTIKKGGEERDRNFADLIKDLACRGIIPSESHAQWEAVRKLRNFSSHPTNQAIMPPGLALSGIDASAREINQLFAANQDYFSTMGTRVRRATGLDSDARKLPVVVGIDVGGEKNGFHLVALERNAVLWAKSTIDPFEAANWCSDIGAQLVGVDCPCGWNTSNERGCREAEAMLAQLGYSSYPTPRRHEASRPLKNERFSNPTRSAVSK